jgi:hypothetical protein
MTPSFIKIIKVVDIESTSTFLLRDDARVKILSVDKRPIEDVRAIMGKLDISMNDAELRKDIYARWRVGYCGGPGDGDPIENRLRVLLISLPADPIELRRALFDNLDSHLGRAEEVCRYQGRCYGPDGNELGTIPLSIVPMLTVPGTWPVARIVAETPGEVTTYHGAYFTQEEAREGARRLAIERDEAPHLTEVIELIRETGYFEDPSAVEYVLKAATGHVEGYVLVTRDLHQRFGRNWVSNEGWEKISQDVEDQYGRDYILLAATCETPEQAGEALLQAINESLEEEEEQKKGVWI